MSVVNTNQWASLGIQHAWWAALSGYYPYGVTGSIANGGNAGMGRLRGVNSVEIAEAEAGVVYVNGDNGVTTSFLTQPQELPKGAINLGVMDQTWAAKSNGSVIYAEGDWDILGGVPLCYSFADLCMVLNAPANAQESTNLDEAGWEVTIILKLQNKASVLNTMATNAARTFVNNTNVKRSSRKLWGQSFTAVADGSTAFAVQQFMSPYPVTIHAYVGDNSTTTVTLNETPAAATATAVQAWQANTKLTYGAGAGNYTVVTSTKVLTFGTAPGAGVTVIIPYQYIPTC
jgi:hypothetical protein